jgi:MFS family permease
VLTVRDARSLICASAASQLGDWLYNAALLGYVYAATGSGWWVGAATIFRLLPYVLLGPLGGTIADRYDRRKVLLIGDLLRLALMVALAAVVATDGSIVLVIALTALASAAGSAERPAAMALLPRLVGESRLGPANALLHTVQDLGVVVGPALGAVLLAVAPNEVAFLANGITFAVSAAFIASLRPAPIAAHARSHESMSTHLADGLRAARSTPFIVPLFVVVAMIEFTYGAQTVQLVLFAEQQLDLGASGYGWLLAASGIGGLLSAVVSPRLTASTKVSIVVVGTALLFCITQLVYAGTELLAVALVVTVAGGLGMVACEVVAETAVARITPSETLGRVMGVFDSLSVGAMVLGALLASLLVEVTSLVTSLLVLGGLSVVVVLATLATLRGLDAISRARADAIASRVAIIERLPIVTGVQRVVIETLAGSAQLCKLPPGVDVVVQGAPAHAFYAVVEGGVVVHRDDEVVAHLGPGSHFGERGLLDNAPRNATVTTELDSVVLRLEGDVLLEAMQASPTMLSAVERGPIPARVVTTDEETSMVDDPTWVNK